MKNPTKALVIFSGGQDSTTCLFWAKNKYDLVEAITFSYGQKHTVEINCAQEICLKHDIKQTIVDIGFVKQLNDSAMVHGGNTSESKNGLPTSFVPNRNQLLITIAHMYAQKIDAGYLVGGMCETDFSGYPDCRQEFVDMMELASNSGSNASIMIQTPLMHLTKAETFELADNLNVLQDVIHLSHTCYEGNRSDFHAWGYGCGQCPACVLRAKGYQEFTNKRSGIAPVTS